MRKYKSAGEISPYIDRLRTLYPYHINGHGGYDAYLVGVQPLIGPRFAPIYRFPGGECVIDEYDLGKSLKIIEW